LQACSKAWEEIVEVGMSELVNGKVSGFAIQQFTDSFIHLILLCCAGVPGLWNAPAPFQSPTA
jgi:hypothetical protein